MENHRFPRPPNMANYGFPRPPNMANYGVPRPPNMANYGFPRPPNMANYGVPRPPNMANYGVPRPPNMAMFVRGAMRFRAHRSSNAQSNSFQLLPLLKVDCNPAGQSWKIILEALENNPTSVEDATEEMEKRFKESIDNFFGKNDLNMGAKVEMKEKCFLPGGDRKILHVVYKLKHQWNGMNGMVRHTSEFVIIKKNVLKSLKDLSSDAVADNIKEVDVSKLDIPKDLKKDVVEAIDRKENVMEISMEDVPKLDFHEALKKDVVDAFDSDWTSNYHKDHLDCSDGFWELCSCWDDMQYTCRMEMKRLMGLVQI